jgi:tricorn protease
VDEEVLRTDEDWTENNRRLVDKLSGGRIGYIWLPNTGPTGYQAFSAQFYAQLDKEGLILDERYNQGGFIDDYIVDILARIQFGFVAMRDGADSSMPIGAIYGPKVMLINESAGSGGDALPYYFKLKKLGPLVGTRTWGGLVGPTAAPEPRTLDGGGISVPSAGFYDTQGRWLIENEGVSPDIEVQNTAAAVIAGHDPQLERAIAEALNLLKSNPVQHMRRPAPPDRVSRTKNPSDSPAVKAGRDGSQSDYRFR